MHQNKYTFFGVLKTWSQLVIAACRQWRIFGVYAAVITVIDAVFGNWSYTCRGIEPDFWCVSLPNNKYVVIVAMCIFYLLFTYLLCAFVTDLHNALFKNSVFKSRNVFVVSRQKLKTTAISAGLFLIATISLVVAYYIIQQPANPNFETEFGYFLIVFVLLMIPLMMIRCAACFAYYMNTGAFVFGKVYNNTSGRSYISVMMFLLFTIMLLVLSMNAYGFFSRISLEYSGFTTALATEFTDNLLKLVIVTVFFLFACAQYIRIEETEELRRAAVAAENKAKSVDEIPAETETPANLTAKAAKKKKNQRKSTTASAPKTKRKQSK